VDAAPCLGCGAADAQVVRGEGACQERLAAAGVRFWAHRPAPEPLGSSGVMCHLADGVLLHPEIGGVRWRWLGAEDRALVVDCALAEALLVMSRWLAARGVVSVDHVGTYHCRAIAGGDRPSQHAFGRAVDVRGMTFARGRPVRVLEDWRREQTRSGRLLHELAEALHRDQVFNVVLTPEYNPGHHDHLHLDLTPGVHFLSRGELEVLVGE
jgi:hypothetical protein